MDIKNLYKYYCFGYNYRALLAGRSGVKVKSVIASIDEFLDFIEEHDLKVTKIAIFNKLQKLKSELSTLDAEGIINQSHSDKLGQQIKDIDKTLDSELRLRDAYILTEKRLGLERILNKIDTLFSNDVYSKLPDIVKYDFSEAGKCIAFERPTAAAFHILRGTEGTLLHYYKIVIKKNRLEKPMWGPMIDQLKTKKNVPKPLLDVLDNIRINFRNPTTHPEAKYGLDEVQDLFNICVDATNRIIKDTEKRTNN